MVSLKIIPLIFLFISLCVKASDEPTEDIEIYFPGSKGTPPTPPEELKMHEASQRLCFSAEDVLSNLSKKPAELSWKKGKETISKTNLRVSFSADKTKVVRVIEMGMRIKGNITIKSEDEGIYIKKAVTLSFSSITNGCTLFFVKKLDHPDPAFDLDGHSFRFDITFANNKSKGKVKAQIPMIEGYMESFTVASW